MALSDASFTPGCFRRASVPRSRRCSSTWATKFILPCNASDGDSNGVGDTNGDDDGDDDGDTDTDDDDNGY